MRKPRFYRAAIVDDDDDHRDEASLYLSSDNNTRVTFIRHHESLHNDDDELDNLYSAITLESREYYTSRALTTAERNLKQVCLELPLR